MVQTFCVELTPGEVIFGGSFFHDTRHWKRKQWYKYISLVFQMLGKTRPRKRNVPAYQALLRYQPITLEICLNVQKNVKKKNYNIK